MRPVVVDTDPGTDDAMAIAMALASAELKVLGLATVAGNVCLSDSTRNALLILEALGRSDVGVWPGSEGPAGGVPEYAYHFHGETGLTVDLGDPVTNPQKGSAVDLIVESAHLYPGSLELMAIGPLTNIADALDAAPELPSLVRRLWIMGGALHCPGNVTPRAEFNFYSDPEAAGRVLSSEMASTVVGLDVCGKVQVGQGGPLTPPGGSVGASLSGRLLAEWLRSHPGEKFWMCDPLAVAVALDPSVVRTSTGQICVVADGWKRGMSIARYGTGAVEIALEVEADRALSLIGELAFGMPLDP
ncbi:MAG: nucleoside hydrolase [Dehalococcoidia bacterium]|nr:nucleoside hydrolase [Dehalococcoidia bacterium]